MGLFIFFPSICSVFSFLFLTPCAVPWVIGRLVYDFSRRCMLLFFFLLLRMLNKTDNLELFTCVTLPSAAVKLILSYLCVIFIRLVQLNLYQGLRIRRSSCTERLVLKSRSFFTSINSSNKWSL